MKTLLIAFLPLMIATTAFAIPTYITIRVKSKDAKFVGSSMGGAMVTIKNVDTGEILANGFIAGTTGSTDTIMKNPIKRGFPISDEKSAKYTATIDISEPALVEIKVYGPLGQRQAANTVSVTQWVVPGKHITGGDAMLLELPGLVVDVLAPPAHLMLPAKHVPTKMDIQANVVMMCGCPIEPGGLWDADKFEVKALIKKDGKQIEEAPMRYAGKTSQFSGSFEILSKGAYEITVYAYDPANGNTGLDKTTIIVQ